jgi:hypothetical protein
VPQTASAQYYGGWGGPGVSIYIGPPYGYAAPYGYYGSPRYYRPYGYIRGTATGPTGSTATGLTGRGVAALAVIGLVQKPDETRCLWTAIAAKPELSARAWHDLPCCQNHQASGDYRENDLSIGVDHGFPP